MQRSVLAPREPGRTRVGSGSASFAYYSLFLPWHDCARNKQQPAGMNDFSTILARLEDPANLVSDKFLHPHFLSLEEPLDSQASYARRPKLTQTQAEYATAAYGAAFLEPQSEGADASGDSGIEPADASTLQSLLDELHFAKDSREQLQSLRRRLAWICHPDRRRFKRDLAAENLMAELNMEIDAALTEITVRSAGKRRAR